MPGQSLVGWSCSAYPWCRLWASHGPTRHEPHRLKKQKARTKSLCQRITCVGTYVVFSLKILWSRGIVCLWVRHCMLQVHAVSMVELRHGHWCSCWLRGTSLEGHPTPLSVECCDRGWWLCPLSLSEEVLALQVVRCHQITKYPELDKMIHRIIKIQLLTLRRKRNKSHHVNSVRSDAVTTSVRSLF